MTLTLLLSAVYTFTAVATGLEKGTPVEFLFAGAGTDRDYETVFTLEQSVEDFCRGLEQAGLQRGTPNDTASCDLWPVGVSVVLDPPLTNFVDRSTLPSELATDRLIYTGGSRSEKGVPLSDLEMPKSVMSLYTLSQSPIQFDGIYEQGAVYNYNLAAVTLQKGQRVTFKISFDPKECPTRRTIEFKPGNAANVLKSLREESAKGPLVVCADFSSELTIEEATAAAQALSVIDSVRLKINGRCTGHLFYQAFLPAVKWLDRNERLVQPFEVRLAADGSSSVCRIEEDWTVDGVDPKLTEKMITVGEMVNFKETTTCFIYAPKSMHLNLIYNILPKLPSFIETIYVFGVEG